MYQTARNRVHFLPGPVRPPKYVDFPKLWAIHAMFSERSLHFCVFSEHEVHRDHACTGRGSLVQHLPPRFRLPAIGQISLRLRRDV